MTHILILDNLKSIVKTILLLCLAISCSLSDVSAESKEYEIDNEFIHTYDTTGQSPQVGDTIWFGVDQNPARGFIVVVENNDGPFGRFCTPLGCLGIDLTLMPTIWNAECGCWAVTTNNPGGLIASLSSQPDYLTSLNLNLDTLVIGQEICREKETPEIEDSTGLSAGEGLDAYGFDTTGNHHLTDTTFDPNGFQQDGTHHITGTEFNSCGCNRDGLTAAGDPCHPADCANSGSQAFADSIASALPDTIRTILTNIRTVLQDSLAGLDCESLRTNIDDLISNNGLDRMQIVGVHDILLEQGMSKQFEKKPKVLQVAGDRDLVIEAIEKNHVDLYSCDAKELLFNELDSIINGILSDTSLLAEVTNKILQQISNWSEYQLHLYSNDPAQFILWVKEQLGNEVHPQFEDYASIQNENFAKSNLASADSKNLVKGSENSFSMSMYGMSVFSNLFFDHIPRQSRLSSLPNFDSRIRNQNRPISQLIAKYSPNFIKGEATNQQMAVYQNATATPLNISDGMPLKIERLIGNKTYSIIIDNIDVYLDSLVFDAFCVIRDPESGRDLLFEALNITIDANGQLTNARLILRNTIQINLFNSVRLTLLGSEGTYVEWDLNGFQSMGIDATVEVCRNLLVPLDSVYNVMPEPQLVAFHLQLADIQEWLEFTVEVSSMRPFAIAGMEKSVGFNLQRLMLDFSSTHTPTFTPIEGYTSPFYDGVTMANNWKGVFIDTISARILQDLSITNDDIVLAGEQLMIDDFGFSGRVRATNVLPIGSGSASGWPISIEDIHLAVVKNQFHEGGMGGVIQLPICDDHFAYTAQVDKDFNFEMAISPQDTFDFDMLIARAFLYNNSYIKATVVDGDFTLSANLHGHLAIDDVPAVANVQLHLPDLSFKNLWLSTAEPHMDIGTWGIQDGSSLGIEVGGFSLMITDIKGVKDTDGAQGVSFVVNLNLATGVNISATGGMAILGRLGDQNGRQKWDYERFVMQSFSIDGSFQGVSKIKGSLEWFGKVNGPDTTYGKGFRGTASVTFESLEVELSAVAQFGKKGDYKYFYVDAMADFGDLGIQLGLLNITGFGGGVAHHMTQQNASIISGEAHPAFDINQAGTTLSGAILIPDEPTGLSLNANIGFAIVRQQLFNGVGSFRIEFDNNLSLSKISITGQGQFFAETDLNMSSEYEESSSSAPSSATSPMSAYVNLTFDFKEPSLHGDLQVFLNLSVLKGAGTGGKLVDAELHFAPDQWYIYIGRPEEGQRCGLIFDLAGINIEATVYFDIGTNVPSMPPLPARVRDLAYKVNRNETLRQSGGGMVFGASLTIEIAIKIGSILEGGVEAGVGFDVMLKKYNDLHCEGSTDEVGINGWYASGQLWAYLYGYLKLFGVNILEAGIAAVMQTRLPNPFWAQATVGVRVKILFVRVNKSFKIELGKNCILVSSDSTNQGIGMDIISFINPNAGAENMEVYFTPEVDFAIPIGSKIEMADLNDPSFIHVFTTDIQELRLYGVDSINIPVNPIFNEDSTNLVVEPAYFLPDSDTFTMSITVGIYKNGTKIADEHKFTTFSTTSIPLDVIPAMNISAAYPANGMWSFHPEANVEHKGFVDLIRGQPSLFYDLPENSSIYLRLTDSDGQAHLIDYIYDGLESIITFDLDPNILQARHGYKLELVMENGTEHQFEKTNTALAFTGLYDEQDWSLPSNESVHGTLDEVSNEHIIYKAYFRVSPYLSFKDKIQAIKNLDNKDLIRGVRPGRPANPNSDPPKYKDLNGELVFDRMERHGSTFLLPLLDQLQVVGNVSRNKIRDAYNTMLDDNEFGVVCEIQLNKFPTSYELLEGEAIHFLRDTSVKANYNDFFDETHFDSGAITFDLLGKQSIEANLTMLANEVDRSLRECGACFLNACTSTNIGRSPVSPDCFNLFGSNATIYDGLDLQLNDVNVGLKYLAGHKVFYSGNLSFN